jgi:hypothetical protein
LLATFVQYFSRLLAGIFFWHELLSPLLNRPNLVVTVENPGRP